MSSHRLPRSVLLASWLQATLRGTVAPDDAADAVRGDDPAHLVVGVDEQPMPLSLLPAALRGRGTIAVGVALPAPGDPAGLAGPPAFNLDVIEAGEAVVVETEEGGLGLVPELDARTVVWRATSAVVPPPLDPAETGRGLRGTLVEVTEELARLDVASWQPEIPDLLLNRHEPRTSELPPGLSSRRIDIIERAALCLEIVHLAAQDEGGSVSAYEMSARRASLGRLDRAARHALMAACSDSLGPR